MYRSLQVRVRFWSIYLSKSCRKSGVISLSIYLSDNFLFFFYEKLLVIYRIHTKIFILCLNFITNINICKYILKIFQVNFISIILNVHNDPCFEDKERPLLVWNTVRYTFPNKAVVKYYTIWMPQVLWHYANYWWWSVFEKACECMKPPCPKNHNNFLLQKFISQIHKKDCT